MSLMSLGRALRPRATAVRALLLGALAVVAVLVGLLGMHVFSTGTTHHAPAVAPETSSSAAAQSEAHDTGHDAVHRTPQDGSDEPCGDCGGTPDPMTLMACVLALLVAALVLSIRPAWVSRAVRPGSPPPSSVAVPAEPTPPDLTILSISRT
ncbi:hypothetical protein B5M43_008350 [Microbacterium sp. MEC084]|uniref:DUF6153 family protein n=1 Tax=Microbacterium sp. MEC084 TaxID=1963027 RepID=UPI00106FFF5A|nr:DUF6153 family protein [Microbacterium sp. MEC084]MCD1268850.1 hypothetical protein [Microbacterium sp. MEC084]